MGKSSAASGEISQTTTQENPAQEFWCVMGEEAQDSSFLFIRRPEGIIWAHEMQWAENEAELISDWQAKSRKTHNTVVVASTEASPKAHELWDHIMRVWDVRVPQLALPWSGPCSETPIPEGGFGDR